MSYQKRKQHDHPGRWYTAQGRLLYHPTYPVIRDDQTDAELGAVCKYAGYLIIDTMQIDGGDAHSPTRWKATPLLCIADRPELAAQTKSLLLESIDRMYTPAAPTRRRYAPGTAAPEAK